MPDVFSTVQDVDSHVVLDYTSRDFTAIRAQLIGLAQGLMPEWQSAGEPADFGTLLLELFAYMGDVMHFYIDRTASEAFLGTAIRRQSVLYIADMLGYTPIGQQSAIVGLDFSLDPAVPDPVTLPAGSRIHNDSPSADALIVFELNTDVTLAPGDGVGGKLPIRGYATEGIMHYNNLLGVAVGMPNTEFVIPDKGVVYGSITMQSREGPTVVNWTYISNLSLARPTQSVFTTFIDEAEYTHVIFGDAALGRIPPVNAEIFVSYRTGVGAEANDLAAGDVTILKPTDSTIDLFGIKVTNPSPPVGGTDPESIDAMRQSIPRAAIRLKNRAITLNDYADLALQVPGVSKSMAHGTVYTSVHVRIAPIKGQADDELMDDLCDRVERYLEDKIIVGSAVIVEPRPISTVPGVEDAIPQLWQNVYVYLMVHVQDSYNRTTVRHNVEAAIRRMMDFDAVDFATRVSIGTIYRMALSIQGVEWVDLIWLDDTAPIGGGTLQITNKALTTNVATLTVGVHTLDVGDQVRVQGVDTTFDGYQTITAVATTTISYAKTAANVTSVASTGTVTSQSVNIWTDDDQRVIGDIVTDEQLIPRIVPPIVLKEATVSHKKMLTSTATLITVADHGLVTGDIALITDVGAPFDGRWVVTVSALTPNQLSYFVPGSPIDVALATSEGHVKQQDPFAPENESDFNDNDDGLPDMNEEERTHDGLWVRAVGGLPGT